MKILGQSFLAILMIVLVACESSSLCLSGQNAIQATLYSASSGVAKDTTLNGVYLWGLEMATNENMPLIADSASVSDMYLPTDIERDTTVMIIRELTVASDLQDTMMFIYERELNYVSGDCGFTYNLMLDTVITTLNMIDSVVIEYPSVKYNENLENVKIFIES